MAAIRIYEPALCCDTGVCGVDVDQSLVEVTAAVRNLQELGADIQRHNLATDPLAFTTDETVRAFMHVVGSAGLPLTVVDGVTVATGSYPSKDQLLAFAGLAERPQLGLTAQSDSGCCDADSACC
ncbi:arsenite efflux transporter metallochaperone ArsD [Cryobacterium sp. TMT1-2-2]|uniref:arsenite efflux transporter metallochaperone ArsD n=1 Tax=Cryobacterium sp. TMT1-2-2 TaxID=1259233 RepID=UPI001068EA3B|nr:arsenite efflux transporter metallochaperone ArsD [Cryobacterium sp. TMT1-2-2]TFD11043.1 arsenite efflux transporter metallochaperone ArsD [Cryobacterium sp. TMT1-2-2]